MNNSSLLRLHDLYLSMHCASNADHSSRKTGSLKFIAFHNGITSNTEANCWSVTSGNMAINRLRSRSNAASVRQNRPAAYTLILRKSSHTSSAVLAPKSRAIKSPNCLSVTTGQSRHTSGLTTVSPYIGSFVIALCALTFSVSKRTATVGRTDAYRRAVTTAVLPPPQPLVANARPTAITTRRPPHNAAFIVERRKTHSRSVSRRSQTRRTSRQIGTPVSAFSTAIPTARSSDNV